jgi:hypothetical protein
MAIQTTNSAAQNFASTVAPIAPGSAKAKMDPRFFEIMLQSGHGINGEVSKASKTKGIAPEMITGLEMLANGESSSQDAALTMLGYQTTAKDLTGGNGGMDMFQGKALATLSRLAMEQAARDSGTPMASPNGSQMRQSVDKSSVRMAVNPASRHPDDLGHLGRIGKSGGSGFTKREEELLLAAAGAENILSESSRVEAVKAQAAATRKVLPSALEHKAGKLSAQYESNNEIDCIGYDRRGGTSYGQYQIASKTGTMDYFIKFLEEKAPDLASKLKSAGSADTGGRSGSMPSTWREISASDPKRFEALQHEFIRTNNYVPAAKSLVLTTGVDVTKRSYALREVLWSTAVQHGPAGAEKIFSQAIEKAEAMPAGQDFDKSVIEEVYRIRGQQFFRHNKRVREAVQSRFRDEKTTAIALLADGSA